MCGREKRDMRWRNEMGERERPRQRPPLRERGNEREPDRKKGGESLRQNDIER